MFRYQQNVQTSLSSHFHSKLPVSSIIIIIGFALLVTIVVFQYAWVSEDCFITLRYVSNTLSGHGAVFNLDEYVQGYTHPLWFVLLLGGCLVFPNPIYVAIGYGLLWTFFTVAVVGYTIFRLIEKPLPAAGLLALFSLLCVLSDPWVSFQTSGLENSLSHLLITVILIECCVHGLSRPSVLMLFLCLLCLNRPDFIFFVGPIGIYLLIRVRNVRQLVSLFIACLPVLIWLVFAWRYYGDIVPNTAYAKMGIYSTWAEAIGQGGAYLKDWFMYDTLAAGSIVVFIGFAFICGRSSPILACVCGVILYILWTIWVGGDFMRGRFFMPVFTASLVLGLILIAMQVRNKSRWLSWKIGIILVILVILLGIQRAIPDPGAEISKDGIVDERAYYPGYSLKIYRKYRSLINPYMDLRFADVLSAYADTCGHVTIHLRNPGTIGYLAGSKVTVIDTLGLTDAFIAKLPGQYFIETHPRPGHPDKYIPVAYLALRGDISILPEWKTAVYQKDCSLGEKLKRYKDSSLLFDPR